MYSHVAIEKISVNIERTSAIDWDSTIAAQRFYCVSSYDRCVIAGKGMWIQISR